MSNSTKPTETAKKTVEEAADTAKETVDRTAETTKETAEQLTPRNSTLERIKGVAKEFFGKVANDDKLKNEGQAQRKRAEELKKAERLEESAEDKRQKAAGYKGQQKAQSS